MTISRNRRLKMLKDVAASYLQLRKTISSLSDEDLSRPGTIGIWSGKDLISHIADWEGAYSEVLKARSEGKIARWPTEEAGLTTDAWNEAQVVARADWSIGEVMEYLEQTHDDLMELLESHKEIDPQEALHYTRDHYAKHYDDLAACRTGK